MLLLSIALLTLLSLQSSLSTTETCYDTSEQCDSTNYQTYVECIRRRHKRSIDCYSSCDGNNCIDTCNTCDCDSCNYSNCQGSCDSCCNSCCNNYIPCSTSHCCHRTCHAQCTTTKCRSSCRKNCIDTISKINVTNDLNSNQPQVESNVNTVNKHNVTTIIHLNNVINHTNIVDIPINLNNTNEQNITLYSGSSHDSVGENPGNITEKCCTVIGPRQCVDYPEPRCFHYRSKQCGPYCTASIVHKEQQQVCESIYPGASQNCRQQIMYIPQPQPRCVYQASWPYVACGLQQPASCEGCYNHYVDQTSTNYLKCPYQCYDDGFSTGPIYRQGPIYRPSYSHVTCPQCYNNPYENYPGYGSIGYASSGYGSLGYGSANMPMPMPMPYQQQIFSPYFQPGEMESQKELILPVVEPYNDGIIQNEPYRAIRDIEIDVDYEPKSQKLDTVVVNGNETAKLTSKEKDDDE